MQNEPRKNAPLCIRQADIENLARQGVERALAARQCAAELAPEQLDSVGGGMVDVSAGSLPAMAGGMLRPPIVAGGMPILPPIGVGEILF